jgi:hypothetical protein
MKKPGIIIIIVSACFMWACGGKSGSGGEGSDSATMAQRRNKKTAWRFEANLMAANVDSMYKDCAPNFAEYGTGNSDTTKNVDSVKADLKDFMTIFPDIKGSNFVTFAHGDSVVVLATWRGTFKNPAGDIQPTGRTFKVDDADIFTFNQKGQITSHKSLQSTNTFFYQVGIPIPPND